MTPPACNKAGLPARRSRGRAVLLLCSVLASFIVSAVVQPGFAQDTASRPKVVATFSILGDLARNVAGDRAEVVTLVGSNSDIHVYTPTAADAQSVRSARLLIVNGLGLEGWLPRLIESSGSKASIVTASNGVAPRKIDADELLSRHHDPGSLDPHAWQSVANAAIYVANIRNAMVAADPPNADIYKANADAYLAILKRLDDDIRDAVAQIPADRRKVISTHAAFGYFAAAYGITFRAPQGVSTDSEPSARDIAGLITQIKTEKIPAVFLENISDPRLIRQVAAESGAAVGGRLYSDSLTDADGEAPTYIQLMGHNIKTIASALSKRS
ncbi:MAG: zinc ABC transporter substrate-binding protein [Bradyrhizobium sp.]|nr:zinc ABC transporter substrate-binding protein [Bradyrhizobium sp.]